MKLNGKILTDVAGYEIVYPGCYRMIKDGVIAVVLWPHPVFNNAFLFIGLNGERKWIDTTKQLSDLHKRVSEQ